MTGDTTATPGRSSRKALLLDLSLIITAVMATMLLANARSNYLSWLEGRYLGHIAFPIAIVAFILTVPAMLLLAVLTIAGVCSGSAERRLCRVFVALLALLPCLPVQSRDRSAAFLDGFAEWAGGLNTAAFQQWRASAVPPGLPTSPVPDYWLMASFNTDYGVFVGPGSLGPLLPGALPSDVRVVPGDQCITMFWQHSVYEPFVVIAPGLSGPPKEFDRTRIVAWKQARPDVVVWLQETH